MNHLQVARTWIAFAAATITFGGHAFGQPNERVDRYGDPLPPGATGRLGTVRLHFGGEVSSAAVSSDGTILIAAGRVCDGKTGKELPKFKGKSLTGIARFSDDMKFVSIGRPNGIERYEIATGKLIEKKQWKEKESSLDRATYTPDLKFVSISSFAGATAGERILDTATGKVIFEIKTGTRVVLSPDGKWAAAFAEENAVVLYNINQAKEERRWKAHERTGGQIYQFSPDGKTLASSVFDGEIRFWDIDSGKMTSEIKNAGGRQLVFAPDGKSILFDRSDTMILHDITTGKETQRFIGHASWLIPAISFSANGKYLASASRDHTVILWDVATGKSLHDFQGHRGPVVSLAFSQKGDVLVSGGAEDHTAIVWDLATQKPRHFLREHVHAVNCIAFSPDGRTIATGDGPGGTGDTETHLRLWDVQSGDPVRKWFAHMNMVRSLTFIADGKQIVSAGGDQRLRMWEVESGKRLHQIRNPNHSGLLSLTPDGKTLVQTGWRQLTCWDIETWNKKSDVATENQDSPAVIILRDGQLGLLVTRKMALAKQTIEAQFRELATGDVKRSFVLSQFRYPQVRAAALSPDETILAVCSFDPRDPSVQLYDTKTGELMTTLHGHTGYMQCLAFSPDGKSLASGSWDTTVLLWDVPRARLTHQWRRLRLDIVESDKAAKVLIDNPDAALRVLSDHLQRAARLENDHAKSVFELGSDNVRTRTEAVRKLTEAGLAAEFSLGLFLERPSNAEHRRRVELALADLVATRKARIDQLIPKLDALDAREAISELVALGSAAEPSIRETLMQPINVAKRLSPRVRYHLDHVLDRIQGSDNESMAITPPQALRALAVVHAIDTPEARRLLRQIAEGPPESNLTRQAVESLKRLESSK